MNFTLEINDLKGCNFDEKKLKLTVEKTIDKIGKRDFNKKNFLLSLGFVSEEEMRKINKKYRGKDYPTDVLSFANFDSLKEIDDSNERNIFLGEILICVDDIKKYCQEKEISFEYEFFKVLSHGFLHLSGLRHGKKMFKIQEEVAAEMDF